MNVNDEMRLRHMLQAANSALRFVTGRSRSDLDRDEMLVFALLHAIEIIGEAANNVSNETRAKLPEIPWQDIVDMRHRLVHGYYDINLNIVWQTVTEDVAPLTQALERLLNRP